MVDMVMLVVNARCLTQARAETAVLAFRGFNHRAEQGEAGEETEHCAHGTYRVAVGATVPPCQYTYYNKGDGSNGKGCGRLYPHVRLVESIALSTFGKECQEIVTPTIDRRKEVGGDASIGTIGCKQCNYGMDAQSHTHDERTEHAISQPPHFLGIGKTILFLLAPSANP